MCSPVDAAVVPVRLSSWATWMMRSMGQGKGSFMVCSPVGLELPFPISGARRAVKAA